MSRKKLVQLEEAALVIAIQERIAGLKHKELFRLISRRGTLSKLELRERTGLTASTLTRALEEMTAAGLLSEAGVGDSTGGRRPVLYRINPSFGIILGLEISRTHSLLAMFDLDLQQLASRRWEMTAAATPEWLLAEIAQAAQTMLGERGIAASRVLGMGVSAVGPLHRASGTILNPLHFPAPGWQNIPIASRLEEKLGIPALLDNGANAALLGEVWAERNAAPLSLLYVHIGVGLRSAMMAGGKLIYGAVDMEGAIGQMIIQCDGPRIGSAGNYGSLEAFVSVPALEREAISRLKLGRSSLLLSLAREPELVRFAHLQQALRQEDPLAIEIVSQSAAYFGIGLANLLNILHPEKVILGGPVVESHPLFFATATQIALGKTRFSPEYRVEFSRGILGEESLVTGAAVMIAEKLSE